MRQSTVVISSFLALKASALCFYHDGTLAASYVQCPGVDWCCKPTDTCVSNGLCRDINNKEDGSMTTLADGSFNFNGLYQTASCANNNWSGCENQCLSCKCAQAYVLVSWLMSGQRHHLIMRTYGHVMSHGQSTVVWAAMV